jgi:GNAT superfamily N-acetyltransferase
VTFVEPIDSSSDALATIEHELRAYNVRAIGPYSYEPIAFVARDTAGEVIGGIDGLTGLGWLHIATLWVSEQARRKGIGRGLVDAAENEARKRGCHGSYLFTYSFQAPEFYRALGYVEFGVLEDFPPGVRRHFLRKAL